MFNSCIVGASIFSSCAARRMHYINIRRIHFTVACKFICPCLVRCVRLHFFEKLLQLVYFCIDESTNNANRKQQFFFVRNKQMPNHSMDKRERKEEGQFNEAVSPFKVKNEEKKQSH